MSLSWRKSHYPFFIICSINERAFFSLYFLRFHSCFCCCNVIAYASKLQIGRIQYLKKNRLFSFSLDSYWFSLLFFSVLLFAWMENLLCNENSVCITAVTQPEMQWKWQLEFSAQFERFLTKRATCFTFFFNCSCLSNCRITHERTKHIFKRDRNCCDGTTRTGQTYACIIKSGKISILH